MKGNTSISISEPKAAVAFIDAHMPKWFPKQKYTADQKERAAKRFAEIERKVGCGYAVERGELLRVING